MLVSPNVLSYYPVKYHTYDREQVNELRETIIEIIRKLKQYKYQYINQVPPTGTTVPPVSPRRVPQPYGNNYNTQPLRSSMGLPTSPVSPRRVPQPYSNNYNTQPPRSSMGLPASPVSPRRVPQPYSNNYTTQPPRSSMGLPTSPVPPPRQPSGLPTTGSPPRQPSGLPTTGSPPRQPSGLPTTGSPPRQPLGLPASVPMTFTDQQLRNIFQRLTNADVVQFQNEWNTITNNYTKNLIYETIMKLEPDTPLIFSDQTDAMNYILSDDTTRKILKIFNVTTINDLRNINIRTYLAKKYSVHFNPPSVAGPNGKCNSEHICKLMNNLLMTFVYEYTEALLRLP
jgi:hypothetical protein